MHLLNPGALWYLLLVPVLLAITWLNFKRRQFLYLQYCEQRLFDRVARPLPVGRYLLKGFFLSLSVAGIVVALSRPAVDSSTSEFPRGKTDVVTMIDVSRSMAALDYKGKLPESSKTVSGTRLDMVKQLIKTRLIPELQGNQLGIVSYAGKAFPQAFLTDDLSSLNWIIDRAVTVSSAPGEGSGMARALAMSIVMFETDSPPDHDRLLVIFSDGGNDDEMKDLQTLSKHCREHRIKVIVAGIGNITSSPIPVKELAADDEVAKGLQHNGKQWYEQGGEVVRTALDENFLKILTKETGGTYVRVSSADDLNIISLAKNYTVSKRAGVKEFFLYPLLIGFLAMIAATVVSREFTSRKRKSS